MVNELLKHDNLKHYKIWTKGQFAFAFPPLQILTRHKPHPVIRAPGPSQTSTAVYGVRVKIFTDDVKVYHSRHSTPRYRYRDALHSRDSKLLLRAFADNV